MSILLSIFSWFYNKTDGYKRIWGGIVTLVTGWIMAKFPGAPEANIIMVLNWIGQVILGAGILDAVITKKAQK